MTVRVRLFAVLRQRAGRESVEIEVDEGATVADALDVLAKEPGLAGVLELMPVRMAVNSGCAAIHVRVGADPISLEAVTRRVVDSAGGAIVTFQGLPRDVPKLDYEAYAEMAEERIAAILSDCVERHGLIAAAAEHRVGPVPTAEASVLVAVSAPHRAEAFAGAREAIDRIKSEAPIWKLETEASA